MKNLNEFTFKNKPNITEALLRENGFTEIGTIRGLPVFKKRVDIPFSINPFRRLVSPNATDGLVLTANADQDLTDKVKSLCLVYRVGINVDTSITDDCIILEKKVLLAILFLIRECYNNHVDYGNFIMHQAKIKPKRKISIIKRIKNIINKI